MKILLAHLKVITKTTITVGAGLALLGIITLTLVLLAGDVNPSTAPLGLFIYIYWPCAIVVYCAAIGIDNAIRHDKKRGDIVFGRKSQFSWRPGYVASTFTVFCLLPILMNGLSIILKSAGFEELGAQIFAYRWLAQPTVIGMAVVAAIAFLFILMIRHRLPKKPYLA